MQKSDLDEQLDNLKDEGLSESKFKKFFGRKKNVSYTVNVDKDGKPYVESKTVTYTEPHRDWGMVAVIILLIVIIALNAVSCALNMYNRKRYYDVPDNSIQRAEVVGEFHTEVHGITNELYETRYILGNGFN